MCRGLEAEENLDALKAKSQKSRLKTLMFPEKGHAAQKKKKRVMESWENKTQEVNMLVEDLFLSNRRFS